MISKLRSLAAAAFFASTLAAPAGAGTVHPDVPATVDPKARYVIYLHGAWPETRGLAEPHPQRGPFEFEKIVDGLAARGLEVIAEVRLEKTNPRRYVRQRLVPQIVSLMEKGVPPENITIAGFSKGGNMALIAATRPSVSRPNIVSLAGCGKINLSRVYRDFLANDAAAMRGRLLSIYDQSDRVAGSCKAAADKAQGLKFTETVIDTGLGHGAFYKANPVWLDLVADWALAAPTTN